MIIKFNIHLTKYNIFIFIDQLRFCNKENLKLLYIYD